LSLQIPTVTAGSLRLANGAVSRLTDGIEAARSIRESFGTQIVFVTAYTDDDGIMERIHKQVPDAPVCQSRFMAIA